LKSLPEKMSYKPNHISLFSRIYNGVAAFLLIIYGAYGVATDSLFMPARQGNALELYGYSAWLMYVAMLFASLNLLTLVVDHYDKRDNEKYYRKIEKIFRNFGYGFFGCALVASFQLSGQDYSCSNTVIRVLENSFSDNKAALFERSCKSAREESDPVSKLHISVLPMSNELTNSPGNAVLLQNNEIVEMKWDFNVLKLSIQGIDQSDAVDEPYVRFDFQDVVSIDYAE